MGKMFWTIKGYFYMVEVEYPVVFGGRLIRIGEG